MESKNFKSGFVAIVGRPNVGKSTLLNNLIGKKVAIMSDKPQTTRNKIKGVLTKADYQAIFIDTPGIHKPKTKLGEFMVDSARSSLAEVDGILYLVDATAKISKGDNFINEMLLGFKKPVIIGLNKIDDMSEQDIKQIQNAWLTFGITDKVIPISALKGLNFEELLENIKMLLSEGPQYYPTDMITDQPENIVVAEIIREKILQLTRDEIPHSVAVVVDYMEERENNVLYINAIAYVERESQKGIIIGKNGSMLKEIGKSARLELEVILNIKIFLEIRVKLKKNWRKNESSLRNMGYHSKRN